MFMCLFSPLVKVCACACETVLWQAVVATTSFSCVLLKANKSLFKLPEHLVVEEKAPSVYRRQEQLHCNCTCHVTVMVQCQQSTDIDLHPFSLQLLFRTKGFCVHKTPVKTLTFIKMDRILLQSKCCHSIKFNLLVQTLCLSIMT